MQKDVADKLRGMARRVTLKNIDDTGETQRASVEVADGIWRDNVEIMHPYGSAGVAPEDGALGIAIAIGGDEGDLVVLPVANPSKRMGNLPAGAAGQYNQHGDRVLVLPDGTIDIKAGSVARIQIGGVTLEVTAGGVAITGGAVTHNGHSIGDNHKHKDTAPGGGLSGVPQ